MRQVTTKDRITAAATHLLTTDGADGVSMRKVAAAVGITPMAIYQYFPDRTALLNAVADAAFAELVRRWQSAERPAAADDRMREMLLDHVDFALEQPRLYAYMFMERRDQARTFPADFEARQSPTLNLVADSITLGISQGIFRPDLDLWETALLFAALLHGLLAMYDGARISMPPENFRALCLRLGERILDEIRR